jgi:hypothetical protein
VGEEERKEASDFHHTLDFFPSFSLILEETETCSYLLEKERKKERNQEDEYWAKSLWVGR